MTQFLYFFPGLPEKLPKRERVAATFARTALRDLLRSDKTWNASTVISNPVIGAGPGGQVGTILSPLPAGGFPSGFVPAYVTDRQEWVKIDDAWLGWFKDMPPTEASLRKPSIIPGYPVRLNDDCDWIAPTIRCQPVASRITLPKAIKLGSDGQRVIGVKEFYQHWQDLTERLWDFRWGHVQMTNVELVDAAAELLALNYYVGPKEVDALGLFDLVAVGSEDQSNWSDVIAASCDWPLVQAAIDEEVKKKEAQQPDSSEPSAGNEDATNSDAA